MRSSGPLASTSQRITIFFVQLCRVFCSNSFPKWHRIFYWLPIVESTRARVCMCYTVRFTLTNSFRIRPFSSFYFTTTKWIELVKTITRLGVFQSNKQLDAATKKRNKIFVALCIDFFLALLPPPLQQQQRASSRIYKELPGSWTVCLMIWLLPVCACGYKRQRDWIFPSRLLFIFLVCFLFFP